jgi:predicted ATPase
MLTRIYVDNFRCLVNFELKLDRLNLLLGENGSGKTTVFEVLRRLQGFICGDLRTADAFPLEDLTRWREQLEVQRFELELTVEKDVYVYSLSIGHEGNSHTGVVKNEMLRMNPHPLFEFSEGTVTVYSDDSSNRRQVKLGSIPLSYVDLLYEKPECSLLTRFRNQIAKMVVIKPVPMMMGSESDAEESQLAHNGSNFASWFRYLWRGNGGNMSALTEQLSQVIPGFDAFSPQKAGEKTEVLKVLLRDRKDAHPLLYNFSELSDGQRQLILLYTLLYGVKGEGYCLFLDEPDNFVALREIQPWLMTLHDACGDAISQAVIISHHPEIMDYLATSAGQWFERQDDGRVQVHGAPLPVGGLKISETIARGWNE